MKTFPSLYEVYNMVQREETQRSLSLKLQPFTDYVVITVKKGMSDVVCFHCGKAESYEGSIL